tara:strand:- start:345 stop:953 length:609 start_codon:yes stop_codon:yes gene_type:complete
LAIFSSCTTTSDVVSNNRIQKRKYTKGFNIKSHNNNHILASKDQNISVYSSEVSVENNDNTNTDLIFASREGVIIEQSIANQTLRTELKNLNSLFINKKKSSKINKAVDPVLLKDLKKEFKANKKEVRETIKTLAKSGQKEPVSGNEKTVAIILLILVGVLGIHKFYLGQIGPGILYLFTGGLCGIGLIIDLVKLLTDTYEK